MSITTTPTKDLNQLQPGRAFMVRYGHNNGTQLAVVEEELPPRAGARRWRVRKWLANSARWTQSTTISDFEVADLKPAAPLMRAAGLAP